MPFLQRLALIFVISFLFSGIANAARQPLSKKEFFQKTYRYKKLDKMKVKFSQMRRIQKLDLGVKTRGWLDVSGKDSIRWWTLHPNQSEVKIIKNKMSVKTLNRQGRVINEDFNLGTKKQRELAAPVLELRSWLSMDLRTIAKNNRIYELSSRHFQFRPQSRSRFSNIEIKLSKTGFVENMTFTEKSGDQLVFKFFKPDIFKHEKS